MLNLIKPSLIRLKHILEYDANKLQPGDILLVHYPMAYLLGYAIQVTSGDSFAHSMIYIGDNKVMEAKRPGIIVTDMKHYLNKMKFGVKLYVLKWRPEYKELANQLVKEANSLKGRSYDFIAFTYMAFILFLRNLGLVKKSNIRSIEDPVDDPDRFFCHQFVAYALHKVDVNIPNIHWTNALGDDFLLLDDYFIMKRFKEEFL